MSTVRYDYTNVVLYSDSKKINGLKLPFTAKKIIIKYGGYIKTGINLSNVNVDVKDSETISMSLDKAEILDNVIIDEQIEIFDEKNSVFNKFATKEVIDILVGEKKKVEDEVISKDILIEAESNAKELLGTLFETLGFTNIEINFI